MLGGMQPSLASYAFLMCIVQLCGTTAAMSASREEVTVGGQTIRLPAPAGFERVDGLDAEADRMIESLLPDSNRYLARFKPIKPNDLGTERSFNAQVLKSLEDREIGDRTFSEMKQSTKKELDQARDALRQEIAKAASNAEKVLQDATSAEAALSVSDVAVLGYFDDSPSSLGFTMALNFATKTGDTSTKSKGVIASMIVPVNGRLIYLYANADFHSEADRQWAEKAVTSWRDVVVASNPRLEGPPASTSIFDGIRRSTIIGAIVGALVGLIAMLFKKKSKA